MHLILRCLTPQIDTTTPQLGALIDKHKSHGNDCQIMSRCTRLLTQLSIRQTRSTRQLLAVSLQRVRPTAAT
jgi:hypothetical protein